MSKTVVIFRKWNDGQIIALFPYNIWNRADVMSYMHIGQHSGACYSGCVRETKPARPDEYKSLYDELISIGYNLEVQKKASHKVFLKAYYRINYATI